MSHVSAFELPPLAVLVGRGQYIARRTSGGFIVEPVDPSSALPAYRVERVERDDDLGDLPVRRRR